MDYLLSCIGAEHDPVLLAGAGLVCLVGVYACLLIAKHAARCVGRQRKWWAWTSIVAAASTAWATHMIGLLAYNPGLQFAFDPVLTVLSLLAAMAGVASGLAGSIGQRAFRRRFSAGIMLGVGITTLHYIGQASYLVRGVSTYDWLLVVPSAIAGILTFGAALGMSGVRRKPMRGVAAPLLILAIAILHFGGMAALSISPNPEIRFPAYALQADIVAPIVAVVSFGLLLLASVGLRFAVVAARQLRRDAKRLSELANLTVEGIALCDGDTIRSINLSLEKLSGYSRSALIGRPVSNLIPNLDVEGLPFGEEQEAFLLRTDGSSVPVRVLRSEVQLGSDSQTIIAVRDQRERLRTETRMRALAYTDTLTGLPNRLSVVELTQSLVQVCRQNGHAFHLLMLDLDRFKWVNDTLGHSVGDELLRQVAARLGENVQGGDFVGRLGGDEFAVIVKGEAAQAAMTAGKLITSIKAPFAIAGHVIEVHASVGIAAAPIDAADSETLARNADLALYRVKADGGAAFRFFEPTMHERAQRRRAMELDLKSALPLDQFALHYQPQLNPLTQMVTGAEALIRWTHPVRGTVRPDDFIPLAEEIGLIGAIGEWVLRTACKEAVTWPGDITIAVNLSPLQLQNPQLPLVVASALAQSGLAAQRLELEVTETALMQDDGNTYENLRALQALGVRISLDDFGTGYSSLNYLRRFPFDKLKIDRSFVGQIPQDQDSVAIVQAIVTLATKLRMTVTVEGVETLEQQAFAAANGCSQIQGFLVSRPVPAPEFRNSFVQMPGQKMIA